MRTVRAKTFDEWRPAARALLADAIPPDAVHFHAADEQRGLFNSDESTAEQSEPLAADARRGSRIVLRVSRQFLELAQLIACHRAPNRFELLYRVVWRLTHGEPFLLELVTDDDVQQLHRMEKSVRRDMHKMKAFVRFRRVSEQGRDHFIAWHRPDHYIVRMVAPFFARRFSTMHWTILTPDESVEWDGEQLIFKPGMPASAAPQGDDLEAWWRTYYSSIFNPARIKLKAMKREMPVRHWATLPETEMIPELLANASGRVAEMLSRQEGSARSAADFFPSELTFDALQVAAAACQGCDLHESATQTVFGEGPIPARVMLVGEQPGDLEDQAGRPFVGPAGEVLNEACRDAGLDRGELYVTNAVKHFKYEGRGKRRLHKKPHLREVAACQPWLAAEIALVQPAILVCLGATAAQSLIGRDFRITQQRGQIVASRWCPATLATYHPSAVLRAPDANRRAAVMQCLRSDLAQVASYLQRQDAAK